MKCTGAFEASCPLSNVSLLDLLKEFAATTEQEKMTPGEANIRDLGLLREKAK